MKRFTSILLASALAFLALPSINADAVEVKHPSTPSVVFDEDGSDGYSGDYVVIYNPSTGASVKMSTGNMSGIINTEIDNSPVYPTGGEAVDRPFKIDIDQEMAAQAVKSAGTIAGSNTKAVSFNVGDKRTFKINGKYSPTGAENVEFKLLAKGEHCYIWTPTSTAENIYPLDWIDESYAEICANEFDSKFAVMQSSFGNHSNGSNGDGRLNMLYYNIDDGWQLGEGYVAGFFSASDLYYNSMPVLNIDTYPGVYYMKADGTEVSNITGTYNTTVHEYQHLINYSVAKNCETWFNECMSAAAEEICYPGSSVASRIQAWLNYYFRTNKDYLNPPKEHSFTSSFMLHRGYSMYDWSNYLPTNDSLVLYAQVSLFAQYIYTQYGNSTFRALLEKIGSGENFITAFSAVTGQATSDFVKDFRIALTANTSSDILGGIYSFRMQDGYNPAKYYNVENLYTWLAPVVYTASSCDISGGGAITIKPLNGVYNPPADADPRLEYVGITLKNDVDESASIESVSLDPTGISIFKGGNATLKLICDPIDAVNYTVSWSSSNESVIGVNGNIKKGFIRALNVGKATVTADVLDLTNNTHHYATANVTVTDVPSFTEAANVENGTLSFDNTQSDYPFVVDAITDSDRISVRSSNQGVNKSWSYFTLTVDMKAGDTMSFDWRVSSERLSDTLTFYANDAKVKSISGETDWETFTYTAESDGTYTFKWEYYKDIILHSGSDCGWIDNISVPTNESIDYLPGDVNMNGTVDLPDAILALRASMQLYQLSDLQLEIGDLDHNGKIALSDAINILRLSMGL